MERTAVHLEVVFHRRLADVPADEWDALCARPPASLTGSRPWVEAALATVDRALSPLLLAVRVRRSGRLVGVASLVIDDRPPRPLVRFAGAPYNDLADLLTLSGHEQAIARVAVNRLVETSREEGWDVQLDDLDPAGALAAAIGHPITWAPGFSAPVVNLRDAGARPSVRRLRRLDRSLERLRADHRVEFALRDGAAMIEALGEFTRQRDARLRRLGRDPALPPLELFDAVVRGFAPSGCCAFMEMLVDGSIVARDLYLLDGEVAMLWLRALGTDWPTYSCGHLLLRAAVDQFAAKGFGALDFGRGAEPYKFSFGARDRRLLDARLSIDEC